MGNHYVFISVSTKNIQNYAAQRLKQFICIATSAMLYFFIISVQSNEAVIEKIKQIPLLIGLLYYGSILLFFVCCFVTYQMTKGFLKQRRQECHSYETVGMKKEKLSVYYVRSSCYFGEEPFFWIDSWHVVFEIIHSYFYKVNRLSWDKQCTDYNICTISDNTIR